jgi:hypothetical protein
MNAFIVTVVAGLFSFNAMAVEPAKKKDEKKQEVKAVKQATPASAAPAAPAAKK